MLIETASNNSDYMRVQSLSVPIGLLVGTITGLLLLLNDKLFAIFYLYAIGGSISTIALCYFVPTKHMTTIKKQPAYIPSFQACIGLREFQLVFIMITSTALISSIYSNAFGMFLSCSYFEFLHILGGYSEEAIRSRNLYVWVSVFWTTALALSLVVIGNIALGYFMKTYDKIRVYQIYTIASAFLIFLSITTTFGTNNVGFGFFYS